MKLLVDVRTLSHRPSGVGMYTYNFVDALSQFEDVEMVLATDVIESDEIKDLANRPRMQVVAYGTLAEKSSAVFRYLKFVQQLIDQTKPDVFWETNNLTPVKIQNPYGKCMVTIQDMFPFICPENYIRIYPAYFRHGINTTLNYVDRVIYISADTKMETEKRFPKAKTIPSFLSYIVIQQGKPVEQLPEDSMIRGKIEEAPYFFYMGNQEKRKGTDFLLKAYEQYCKEGGRTRLYLAGKMREEDINQLYQTVKAKDCGVEYLGYVSDIEKQALLRGCEAFVFPSRAEGFGMPMVEAMECECPIIATDLPVFEELFKGTFQKVRVDDVDGLVQAMLQVEEAPVEAQQKCLAQFTKEKLGERFYDMLAQLIQE